MSDQQRISQLILELRAMRPPFERIASLHTGMERAGGSLTNAETLFYGLALVQQTIVSMANAAPSITIEELTEAVTAILRASTAAQAPDVTGELEEVAEEAA